MFLVFEATLEGKLGLVEEHVITTAVDQASTSPGNTKYIVMRNGKKYASGHGHAVGVRKFKSKFPKQKESTCRCIKKYM